MINILFTSGVAELVYMSKFPSSINNSARNFNISYRHKATLNSVQTYIRTHTHTHTHREELDAEVQA